MTSGALKLRSLGTGREPALAEGKDERPKQQTQDTHKRCPRRAAFARLYLQLLDSRRGRTIKRYECFCGERIWDDPASSNLRHP